LSAGPGRAWCVCPSVSRLGDCCSACVWAAHCAPSGVVSAGRRREKGANWNGEHDLQVATVRGKAPLLTIGGHQSAFDKQGELCARSAEGRALGMEQAADWPQCSVRVGMQTPRESSADLCCCSNAVHWNRQLILTAPNVPAANKLQKQAEEAEEVAQPPARLVARPQLNFGPSLTHWTHRQTDRQPALLHTLAPTAGPPELMLRP